MYWLRWHYHVKDIAGAPYKIKKKEKKRKTKQQNRLQSVVTGRQQLYCAVQSRSSNHCQTTTEKVQSSTRDGAFLTDDGRLFHARAEATGKARSPSVERLVDGTTSMAEPAERRRRRVSTSDVRCRDLRTFWHRAIHFGQGVCTWWAKNSNFWPFLACTSHIWYISATAKNRGLQAAYVAFWSF